MRYHYENNKIYESGESQHFFTYLFYDSTLKETGVDGRFQHKLDIRKIIIFYVSKNC